MPGKPKADARQLASADRTEDPGGGARDLVRLRQLTSAGICESLRSVLPSLPDPESAIQQFERLAETASRSLLVLLEEHPNLVYWAALVFAYSPWLGETLINNQDLLPGLLPPQSLDRTCSAEALQESFVDLGTQSPQSDTAALLARFKRRQYVRIMLRDLLGLATLAETTVKSPLSPTY